MWKILIADDEPKIQRGLAGMISQMNLDAKIVGTAEDGEIALEMAQRLQPDIMLVDICMPFLDGLELIERLKSVRDNMRVIVITGHEEFSYAKKALEMSVYAFLLKPVVMQELRSKLEGAMDALLLQRQRHRYYAFAMEQLEKQKDTLRECFFHDAIMDVYDHDEIRERCALLDVDASKRYEMLLAVPVYGMESKASGELVLRYEVEGAIRELFSHCRSCWMFSDSRGNLLFVYDGESLFNQQLAKQLAGIAKEALGLTLRVEKQALSQDMNFADCYDRLISLVFDHTGVSAIVASAQSCIAKNYMRPNLGLGEVAEEVGVTPTYLSRLMKQELGMPFSKYLTTLRMDQAVLLMEKGMLLKDVATRVGYSTPYYFSTAFKKTLSVSPNAYRNEGIRR